MSGLATRVLSSLVRARLSRVDDSGDVQRVQVQAHGEPRDADHLLPFGLACRPPLDSRGILLSVGSAFDHLVALGLALARYRPRDLDDGDVTLYSAHDARIDLRSSGVAVKGNMTVDGDVDADGYKAGGAPGLSGVVSIPTPGGAATLTYKGGVLTATGGAAVFVPSGG